MNKNTIGICPMDSTVECGLAGVSNAMQAVIRGHIGADESGRELMISSAASAANSPPILRDD